MEIDQRSMAYSVLDQYAIGSHSYPTDCNSNLAPHGQYYPEPASGWSSSIHPFHENINWVSYGLPNPGAKCPPMSAHSYAIARRNERERNRVRHINSTFDNLRKHLPSSGRKRKLSKVDTLKMAAKYINHLQKILDTTEGEGVKGKDTLKAKILADNNNIILSSKDIKKERCCTPFEESRLSLNESEACSHMISPGSDYKLRDAASPVDVTDDLEGVVSRGDLHHGEVKDLSHCSVSTDSHEDKYTPSFLGVVQPESVVKSSCAYVSHLGYLHQQQEAQTVQSDRQYSCQFSKSGLPSSQVSPSNTRDHTQTKGHISRQQLSTDVFVNSL